MSTVLLVGEDDLLLQTRAAVLRSAGVDTVCSSASAAITIQENRQCPLAILCHSLPEYLCTALSQIIHTRWPETLVLRVASTRAWEQADGDGEFDAVTPPDPEHLIQRTVELLQGRGPDQRNPNQLTQ
jgi:hypothetical protein